MAKNLCYQMVSSIENAMALNQDKHSAKKDNKNTYKIYSYASRKEMIDFAFDFSNYIKKTYPDIKKVKDINILHINFYLSSKVNVTQATMQSYVARLNKLELCCCKKFSIKLDWHNGRVVPKQSKKEIRTVAFTENQIKGIEEYFKTKKECNSMNAFYLAKAYSLRAESVCKIQVRDINFNTMKLHIHEDKGKRSRDLPINIEDVELLKKLIVGKENNERVIPLRPNSICAYLNRACKKLGYTNITAAKSSYHALRKYSISKYFRDKLVLYGAKEAERMCSIRLGHSSDRVDIISRYIFK